MKKILALVCSIVMIVSMCAITSNATVEGVTVSLEFTGYEVVSAAATFAKVDVKVTVPETLKAYAEIEPDWITSTDYTYEGLMLQGMGIDIPYVDGLTFVKAKSVAKCDYVTITANATDKKAVLSYAATGDKSTYYAGEIGTVATLYYLVADTTATYDLAISDAVYGFVSIAADGTSTPYEYTFEDFTVTNDSVAPEVEEFEPETIKGEAIEASATNIELEKDPATAYTNTYLGTAVFTATLGADVNYSETGFIFAKDGVEGKGLEKMADGNAVTGNGTFEFTVAMYGIPVTDAGELAETITAIPYYITAE